jgi:uncharacterized membrane protein YeaQ/YmgE (transglycosylase-associated protein family)
MITTLIVAAILGAFVGGLARLFVHSRVKGGCGTNIALGAIGALLGSIIFRLLGGAGFTGLNLWSFFVALVGAMLFLLLHRALSR